MNKKKILEKEIDNFFKIKEVIESKKFSYVTYKFTDNSYSIFCYAEKREVSKVEVTPEKTLLIMAGSDTQILIDLLDSKINISTKDSSILISTKETSVFLF